MAVQTCARTLLDSSEWTSYCSCSFEHSWQRSMWAKSSAASCYCLMLLCTYIYGHEDELTQGSNEPSLCLRWTMQSCLYLLYSSSFFSSNEIGTQLIASWIEFPYQFAVPMRSQQSQRSLLFSLSFFCVVKVYVTPTLPLPSLTMSPFKLHVIPWPMGIVALQPGTWSLFPFWLRKSKSEWL